MTAIATVETPEWDTELLEIDPDLQELLDNIDQVLSAVEQEKELDDESLSIVANTLAFVLDADREEYHDNLTLKQYADAAKATIATAIGKPEIRKRVRRAIGISYCAYTQSEITDSLPDEVDIEALSESDARNNEQILTPNVLSEIAKLEWLRAADPILMAIHEMDIAKQDENDPTVITATYISEETFEDLFSLLVPDLAEDETFKHFYDLARYVHAQQPRDRAGYDHFTGHVLPATLALAYKRAQQPEINDQDVLKDSILITMWHDLPEDYLGVLITSEASYSEIIWVQQALKHAKLNNPSVYESIMRMNKPDRGVDETSLQREVKYIESLHPRELPAKFFERMNSWRHDLENMQEFVLEGDDDGLKEAYVKAEKYIMKSIGVLRLMKANGFTYEAEWFIAQYALFGIDIEV